MLCWNSGLSFDVWSHVTLILLIRVVQFVYDIVSKCEIIKHLKSYPPKMFYFTQLHIVVIFNEWVLSGFLHFFLLLCDQKPPRPKTTQSSHDPCTEDRLKPDQPVRSSRTG